MRWLFSIKHEKGKYERGGFYDWLENAYGRVSWSFAGNILRRKRFEKAQVINWIRSSTVMRGV
jgi:hypothetical protein